MKTKRKVKVCSSELIDVDVEHISLVHRPAIRQPFGIMKAEQKRGTQMFDIDLSKLFSKSEAALVPVVTSILVNGEVSEGLLSILKAEGFLVDQPQVQGDVTVFPQDAEVTGNEQVVKITDNVAMAVSVIKADGAFHERCAARGFYPSISIATELLQDELYRAVEKSDSPGAAAQKITDLVADFGQYMSGLIGSLPTMVFKAEEIILKAETSAPVAEAPTTDDAGGDGADGEEADGDEDNGTVEKNEGDGENEGGDEPTPAQAPALDIDAIISAVQKGVTDAIQPQITSITDKLGELDTQISEVADVAKAAKDTANMTVFGGVFDTGVRDERPQPTAKSEEDFDGGPMIDTGFAGFNRKGK